jgi:hypothetical protein
MKPWLKILLIILLIGIIAAILVYIFVYNKPHPDYLKAKPDFKITAADFYLAFKERTAESEKLYSGKVIEINGTMTRVESSDTIVTIVFVFNQGMFGDEGIRCAMLPEHFEKARILPPGTLCRIKGFCSGFNDPDVILENCSISY